MRPQPPAPPPPPPADWTVGRLLEWTAGHLARRGVESARLEAELLVAHALGVDRVGVYTRYPMPAADEERARLRALLARRDGGEPVAYLLGRREFYALEFEVTPAVLIPRPETELLVELVRARAADQGQTARGKGQASGFGLQAKPALSEVGGDQARAAPTLKPEAWSLKPEGAPHSAPPTKLLDVGTGSGCIAIAAARWCPALAATAFDVSEAALAVARRNAARHGVADRVRFVMGDLRRPWGEFLGDERFDVIAANPPYVADGERAGLPREVRDHEPAAALFAGPDGLALIAEVLAQAPAVARPGALFVMEFGDGQAAAVERLARATPGLCVDAVRTDHRGRPRVLAATLGGDAPA